MKSPEVKFLGLTWVGWLNVVILQFLFVRLGYGASGQWQLLKGILPLTGWWSDYIYLKSFVPFFYEQVSPQSNTRWWHARAYYDVRRRHVVMVIYPFHYLVLAAWWLNLRWSEYRHRESWIDRQISTTGFNRVMSAARESGKNFGSIPDVEMNNK
ncbi:hypothetical protein [Desulfuromonas acetoxidans]|uniref:hypothetical protein n=1 Tax=Desulfuromonas acetoxidans TaxID=891 RepID=UPI002931D834|nr:hypothetical protein [Desulfuromonas acetoxidans]